MAKVKDTFEIYFDYPNHDRAMLNAMSMARMRLQSYNNLHADSGPDNLLDEIHLELTKTTVDIGMTGQQITYFFNMELKTHEEE